MMLAWMLLAAIPMDRHIVVESLDVCESNVVWREDWSEQKFVDPQWIFRRDGEILHWQWDRNCSVSYHPNRVYLTDGNRLRVLRPLSIIGTISNYDREAAEREWLPEGERRGLRR